MDIMIEVKTVMMHEINEFSISLKTCVKLFDMAKNGIRITVMHCGLE